MWRLGWGGRAGSPRQASSRRPWRSSGFAFAFLLGLLQIFVTNHYEDARSQADTEATTLVKMVVDLNVFPQRVRLSAQYDVVCYMRSVIDQDWKRQEQGIASQAPETLILGDRIRNLRRTLPLKPPIVQDAYSRFAQDVSDAGDARQSLLFLGRPTVPTVLWVLVFVSAGMLFFLIVSEFRAHPRSTRIAVLVVVTVLLTLQIGSLVSLDRPFGPIARVGPNSLTSSLGLLSASRADNPVFRPCTTPAQLRNG